MATARTRWILAALLAGCVVHGSTRISRGDGPEPPDNRKLGSIFNSDINGLFLSCSGKDTTPAEYRQAVAGMLGYEMNVLAQNVGLPDPVIYRSKVATTWDKYHNEVVAAVWGKEVAAKDTQAACMKALLDAGTDPLQITIEACRKKGVLIVASYRMNAEDFYQGELDLDDFGRQHKHLRIPGANCLDPVHPEVYRHRMAIFREVAENYDIDGIEFDFKRWYHMISDPHKNHPILTRMVRETRQMLDAVAKKKGRPRLLLGVRVPASLDTPPSVERFPGLTHPESEFSCKDLGTDAKTWIEEGLVDYVCPSLFWPRLPGVPGTKEFAALAKGKNVGIYPTVFPLPAWAEDEKDPVWDSSEARRRHRHEIARAALQCYEQGADGISTFNWNRDDPDAPLGKKSKKRKYVLEYGRGCEGYSRVNIEAHRALASRRALEALLKADPPTDRFITVRNPKTLPQRIPAERIPIGITGDYKPSLALVPGGDLLLVMFHGENVAGGKIREDMILYRSAEGGRTWGERQVLPLLGREPYFSVLRDGTLFITTHLLANDVRNTDGYIHSYVHRSTDRGKTWSTVRIGAEDVPGVAEKTWTHTSRNVLELRDGTLILGVSAGSSRDHLWRSKDKGQTWDKSLACQVPGFDVKKQGFPWHAETVFWQSGNGDILGIARCFSGALPPLAGTDVPKGDDSVERMAVFRSRDGGRTWTLEPELGSHYAEHYQAVLRMPDKRLLLTFTVRGLRPPLGLQAVLGTEKPDGFVFDFKADRLVLDEKTPANKPSGGGFGNTVQLEDGQLVSAYTYRSEQGNTHAEVVRWRLPVARSAEK